MCPKSAAQFKCGFSQANGERYFLVLPALTASRWSLRMVAQR